MTQPWIPSEDCGCKIWTPTHKCSGDTFPKGFVHPDDLPSSYTVYVFDDECWYVDPSEDKVCFPKDGVRIAPGHDYGSCDACEDRPDDNTGSGGGGGNNGGGNGKGFGPGPGGGA